MSDEVEYTKEDFMADIAETATELEICTASAVVPATDENGNEIFLAVIVGVEVFDTFEEAKKLASMAPDESDDKVPAGTTIQ